MRTSLAFAITMALLSSSSARTAVPISIIVDEDMPSGYLRDLLRLTDDGRVFVSYSPSRPDYSLNLEVLVREPDGTFSPTVPAPVHTNNRVELVSVSPGGAAVAALARRYWRDQGGPWMEIWRGTPSGGWVSVLQEGYTVDGFTITGADAVEIDDAGNVVVTVRGADYATAYVHVSTTGVARRLLSSGQALGNGETVGFLGKGSLANDGTLYAFVQTRVSDPSQHPIRNAGLRIAADGAITEVPFIPRGVTASGSPWYWEATVVSGYYTPLRVMLAEPGGPVEIYRPEVLDGETGDELVGPGMLAYIPIEAVASDRSFVLDAWLHTGVFIADPDFPFWQVERAIVRIDDGALLQLDRLVVYVAFLELSKGLTTSFDQKLEAAIGALTATAKGQRADALRHLDAFRKQVEAQRGRGLSDREANLLLAELDRVLAQL